jgi:hypothetical protein
VNGAIERGAEASQQALRIEDVLKENRHQSAEPDR